MNTSKQTQTNPPKEIFLGIEEENIQELDLIKVQKESWKKFLDNDLKQITQEFFPIEDYTGKKFALYFEDLFYGEPRFPLELCLQKKLTFDSPVYARLRLINKKTGSEKEQDVYFFNV